MSSRALAALASLAGAGVLVAGSPLPRITPDSASYLTGAEHIALERTFSSCDGPIAVFAPGYSAAMAPFVRAGLDATTAALIVNVIATASLVLAAALLARGASLSTSATILVAGTVAGAYATLRNGALAWSEPLFGALLAWLLLFAIGRRGEGLLAAPSIRLAGVVTLTWALLLTRHSGIFVIPAILVAAWLGSRTAAHRVVRVGALALVLVAVPSLWWARNIAVEDDPFGRRSESLFSVWEVVSHLPDGLSSLALPAATPLALRIVALVPIVAACVLAWRRVRTPAVRVAVIVLTTAVAGYTVGVTAAATRTIVDPIDTRLLAPILAPAAVLAAIGLTGPRTRLQRALTVSTLAVVVAMAVLAPGVVWRGHTEERDLAVVPDDVSCAEWPARYAND